MEKSIRNLQERNTEIVSQEKYNLKKSEEQNFQCCCSAYYNIFSCEIDANLLDSHGKRQFGEIDIMFEAPQYLKYLQKLKLIKLTDITNINLINIKNRNKHILNFIDFTFPSKASYMWVACSNSLNQNKSYYFNSLIKICYKVTQNAAFYNLTLSASQLKRLVAACRHVQRLSLGSCSLSVPRAPDFSRALENCKIERISLIGSGNTNSSNWKYNFDEFVNLIQGLSSSSHLRLSLSEVNLSSCELEQTKAKEIFIKNQLEGVKIINEG
ncbi:unnamed protein product [Moneuplotes crassus]|uniref:Uncharacterized protein n=1 Tax=Euplotes crassus TaxID=5936 RepID=A0AAD1X5V7_EUPCR|nr:unnamed protein product [Moneuplotes crassus]